MLRYSKMILEKVSFDQDLFAKELQKSINFIEKEELPSLKNWCDQKFGHIYPHLLEEVFNHSKTAPERNNA